MNDCLVWHGPFLIGDWLRRIHLDADLRPPEHHGAYLVSMLPWTGSPTAECQPLYVGGQTGRHSCLRSRMGALVSDGLGFSGNDWGRHSGAQSLFGWCRRNQTSLLDLWIAWCVSDCHRCAEVMLHTHLRPALNKVRPARCPSHRHPVVVLP